MRCAKRLLAENLTNGEYILVKEGAVDEVVCHLQIDNSEYWFTSHKEHHQTLPQTNFKHAYYISIENGVYKHVGETAISMWLVDDEDTRNRIIDTVEGLILGNVIKLDK